MKQESKTSINSQNRRPDQGAGFGLYAIIILALIPVPLWLAVPSALPRFGSFPGTMASLGQLAALVGAVLFALNLMLSARPRFLEKYFNGLTRLYARHTSIGKWALILLLMHPLLLLPRYTGGKWETALAFLLPGEQWDKNFGVSALWLMLALIIITLYLRPKYNIWKWTHKFLGMSFFLASLHIWFISSDVSFNMPLRYYVLGVSALGLATFIYKSILGRWTIPQIDYRVTDVQKLNENVYEISMEPANRRLIFSPGQYVFVSFRDDKVSSESHPFSISSAPEDQLLTLTIKELGDFTSTLGKLSAGALARLEGPFGTFSFERVPHNQQIWIAGGIGITPFLSMAKDLLRKTDYQVDLYYCTRNEEEAVRTEYLKQLEKQMGGRFRLYSYLADRQNRITAEFIEKNSGGLANKDIFICAPPVMITSLKQQFVAQKVAGTSLHSEEFNY